MCKCTGENINSTRLEYCGKCHPKRHKHAELIKAWADGAKIECLSKETKNWNYTPTPVWLEDYKYRIKPAEKSLGQIAHGGYYNGRDAMPWHELAEYYRNAWEAAALAVAEHIKNGNS